MRLVDDVPLLIGREMGKALHGGDVLGQGHAQAHRQVSEGIQGVHEQALLSKSDEISLPQPA